MMLIQIIVFHMLAIAFASSDSTPDNDADDQADFIEKLNERRKIVAIQEKIQNMNELQFDDKFAAIAKQFLVGKAPPGLFGKWRYIVIDDYKTGAHLLLSEFLKYKASVGLDKGVAPKSDYYVKGLEHLEPLQTKIGCAKREKEGKNGDPNNSIKDNIICALGPAGSLSWHLKRNLCSNGFRKFDQMCYPVQDVSQMTFIDKLNNYRKEAAKIENIYNMHKLAFSRKLAQIAQKSINSTKPPCLYVSCRYATFGGYDKVFTELDTKSNEFIKLSEEEKEKLKTNNVHNGWLEHVLPLQTKIGCASTEQNGVERVICLLGSEGSLDSWFKSVKTPKLDCLQGYSNGNGLCVPYYEIGVKNNVKTTEKPEITIEKNNPEEASTVPTQNSVTTKTDNTENLAPKTIPPDGNSNGIPPIKISKITSAPFARPTTTESELDRLIAKYQREEQDGDLPSEEDEEEHEFPNSGSYSALISIILIMFGVLFE